MSKVCSERLYVRNELLGLEVNQSPKTVCHVKHSRLFFLPEVKTLAQFKNGISFQVTEDGGEATCSTLQENCPILSYHFSYCVFSSFLLSLLLLPYCLFPCTFLLRNHYVHRRLQSAGYKNFFSPRFI